MYAPSQPYTPQMMPTNGFNPQYTGMPTVSPPPIFYVHILS